METQSCDKKNSIVNGSILVMILILHYYPALKLNANSGEMVVACLSAKQEISVFAFSGCAGNQFILLFFSSELLTLWL